MSKESAEKFYDDIQGNDALRAKLEAASKEERPGILKDAGYDFTKEEMKEVAAGRAELSPEDLEKVTGGSTPEWVGAAATATGAVAAAF